MVAEVGPEPSLLTNVLPAIWHFFQSSISSLRSRRLEFCRGRLGLLHNFLWSQVLIWSLYVTLSFTWRSTFTWRSISWLMAGYFCSWVRGAQGPDFGFWNVFSHYLKCPQIHKVPQRPQSKTFVCMEGWEEWRGLYWGLPLNSHGSCVLKQNIRRQKCHLFLAGGHNQPQGWWH